MPRPEEDDRFLELGRLITHEANRIMASIDTLTATVQSLLATNTKTIADQAAAIAALAGSGSSNPALDALNAQLAASQTALAASTAALETALGTATPAGVPPVPAGIPVSVTAGSPVITFQTPQTFAKGAAIAFAGVAPQSTIATATSASVTANLSAPFTGSTNAQLVTAATTPPPGTPATTTTTPGSFPPGVAVGLTEGSPAVSFQSAQDVVAGQSVIFALQPGVSYQWLASGRGVRTATLTSPYNGPSNLSSVTA